MTDYARSPGCTLHKTPEPSVKTLSVELAGFLLSGLETNIENNWFQSETEGAYLEQSWSKSYVFFANITP